MPSYSEKRGKIRARVRVAGHPPQSRTFARRREAAAWARDIETKLRAGDDLDSRTVSDAIAVYRETEAGQKLDGYERRVLAWWDERLGRRRVQELKRAEFYQARDALRSSRGRPLRPATRNRRVALIAAVLTHAMRLDWITHNPARLPRLAEDNLVERPVTPRELEQLLAACRASPEPRLYAMVICAMCSGARAGELKRLVWRDIDLEAGVAGLLKTKSGRRRPIPIRGSALEELRRIRSSVPDDDAPGRHVFTHADGSGPFEYGRAWREARARAGLRDLRFHDLRHLAASTLAEAGTSTRELMAFLGHSNPSTTARYAHLVDRHIVQLGDVLAEKLLGGLSHG